MKAVVQTRYGSTDALEVRDVAMPEVGDADVLVRVRAASLHPDVWHVVVGRPMALRMMGAGLRHPTNPVPGTDAAGVVEKVGRRVSRFDPGDEVFGETIARHQWTNGGAFAEYVSVPQNNLTHKPANVTFEQAATVPTAGIIVLQNLRGGRLVRRGAKVLVNGAAGGTGSIALQIARSRGAHVTGVDVTGRLDLVRSFGADEVVDGTRVDFTAGDTRYDLIFDVPGNRPLSACLRSLTPDGKYVLIGHERFGAEGRRMFGLLPRFMGLMLASLFANQLRLGRADIPGRAEAVTALGRYIEDGAITPVIDSTFPLERVADAFRRMLDAEVRGRVVLLP